MIDPPRLRDAGSSKERELFARIHAYQAPAASRTRLKRRTAYFLGISAISNRASAIAKFFLSKPGLATLIGGAALAVAGARYVLPSRQPAAPSASRVAPALGIQLAPPLVASPRVASPPPADSASAELGPVAKAEPHPAATASVPENADALAEEVAALDLARNHLRTGDASAALRDLSTYDQRFAHGHLKLEAWALRIESLAKVGRSVEAETQGKAFIARHPNGFLADRVRRTLGLPVAAP